MFDDLYNRYSAERGGHMLAPPLYSTLSELLDASPGLGVQWHYFFSQTRGCRDSSGPGRRKCRRYSVVKPLGWTEENRMIVHREPIACPQMSRWNALTIKSRGTTREAAETSGTIKASN